MREAIRQRLISQVPVIGDRVFEPHAAGADTEKPYIVITQGPDTDDTQWTGFRRIIEVWPNVSRTTFAAVDSLANAISTALDRQLLTTTDGEKFTCLALGPMGDDLVIEDWDIITRGLRFAIIAIQPVAMQETYSSDPWVSALAMWAGPKLPGWTIYKDKWPTGYVSPSVLWRVSGMEIEPMTATTYKVQKTIVGHFLGTTPNQQAQDIVTASQGLSDAIKIVLDEANRRYLTVGEVKISFEADAMRQGQLRVTLSRITNRLQADYPLIGRVFIKDP